MSTYELDDDLVREHCTVGYASGGTSQRLALALRSQIPVPIVVGDLVNWSQHTFNATVASIDGEYAWCKCERSDGGYIVPLAHLRLVS